MDKIARENGYMFRSEIIREALDEWLRKRGYRIPRPSEEPKKGIVIEIEV